MIQFLRSIQQIQFLEDSFQQNKWLKKRIFIINYQINVYSRIKYGTIYLNAKGKQFHKLLLTPGVAWSRLFCAFISSDLSLSISAERFASSLHKDLKHNNLLKYAKHSGEKTITAVNKHHTSLYLVVHLSVSSNDQNLLGTELWAVLVFQIQLFDPLCKLPT